MDQERKLPSSTKEGDGEKYRPWMLFIPPQHSKALKRAAVRWALYGQGNSLCPERFTQTDVRLTQSSSVPLGYNTNRQFPNADT